MLLLMRNKIKHTIEKGNGDEIDIVLTEYARKHLDHARSLEKEFSALHKLPIGVQYHYSTGILKYEVDNGGFTQFLFNSSKVFLFTATNAYHEINAIKHYDLLMSIIKHLYTRFNLPPNENGFELLKRIQTYKIEVNSDWDEFKSFLRVEQFDNAFYTLEDSEGPIWDMLLDYIKTNIDKFL